MLKIHKGDEVQILAGKDKGKNAKVDRVSARGGRVLIASANLYKRHVRKMNNIEGGIIDIPKPINISNVGLICPNCKRVTRVGFEIEKGDKKRICKRCKKII